MKRQAKLREDVVGMIAEEPLVRERHRTTTGTVWYA